MTVFELSRNAAGDLTSFLQNLVAIPSTSGREQPVIERIEAEMHSIGFDEIRVDPLGNLLGRIGNGRRCLAIDGHCDVVDVGNPQLWQDDPFSGAVRNGHLYGRGSCDQKGGLACAVYTGKILKEAGVPDSLTLWVIASIQEEDCEGFAWKYIVEEDGLRPDAVVLTEPTNCNIYRGHRGRVEIKVKTSGVSCHGSAPERGDNAIYKMAPVVQEIEALNQQLGDDPFLGKGSVTISEIRSTSPSLCAVADSCMIHLDRRLTHGETIESSLAEIHRLKSVRQSGAEVWVNEYRTPSYTGKVYPMPVYCPTWVLDADHALLETARQSYESLFRKQPKIDKWTFSTNGVGTMGRYRIPTLGFGPGNEIQAHSPNEHIPVDHLVKAVAFYAQFATDFAAGD